MRTINWDEPLSEEDKGWLRQRDRHAEIAASEAKFADMDDESTEDDDDEDADDYDSWKVAELQTEAEKRRPAIDLSGVTRKADLIAALRTWDAANKDADA